jgi:hypothetical protein
MNPATWKAYALADIVTRLMAKNRSYEWGPDIQTLSHNLRTMAIDALLQVSCSCLTLVINEANGLETCLQKYTTPGRARSSGQLDDKDHISPGRLLFCSIMKDVFLFSNFFFDLKVDRQALIPSAFDLVWEGLHSLASGLLFSYSANCRN